MIDIGLSNIALVGVVALVVIGPERLPKVARMAGSLLGRAQRYISEVKSEVSREMELEELRKMQKDVQDAAGSVEESISKEVAALDGDFQGRLFDPVTDLPPNPEQFAIKAKSFRKKKLSRTSAVPSWYKQQTGRKTRVISGAARVSRHRPQAAVRKSPVSFH